MKILLDENVPRRLKNYLSGHDVFTVQKMGWRALENGDLMDVADPIFDVLITIDKNMQYQQNFTGRKISMIVLLSKFNQIHHLLPLVPELHKQLNTLSPGSGKIIGISPP